MSCGPDDGGNRAWRNEGRARTQINLHHKPILFFSSCLLRFIRYFNTFSISYWSDEAQSKLTLSTNTAVKGHMESIVLNDNEWCEWNLYWFCHDRPDVYILTLRGSAQDLIKENKTTFCHKTPAAKITVLINVLIYPVVGFVPSLQELLLEKLPDTSRSSKLLHDGLCFLELLLLHKVSDALQICVKGLFQRRHGDLWQRLTS